MFVARFVRFAAGAVLDFLVEDRCALCRRLERRPDAPRAPLSGRGASGSVGSEADDTLTGEGEQQGAGGPWGNPAAYLLEPVKVRLFRGGLTVTNHPVCAACAARFVVAESWAVVVSGFSEVPGAPSGGSRDAAETLAAPRPEVSGQRSFTVVSPFMTTQEVLEVVHLLKFAGYVALAEPMGRSIAWAVRRFAGRAERFDVVVPTPMDARSRRARRFDHAEQLADVVAADLGVSVSRRILVKTVRTRMQSLTPREKRFENVSGAFSCPAETSGEIPGARVLLVDDLVTSGATAAACASALLGAGAASVTVACFGRAL